MSLVLGESARSRFRRESRPPVAFEITGPKHGPVVAVLGGISSSRHVTATQENSATGWWPAMVGPGRPIDTGRFRVISIDYLGEAANGAPVRTRDQADALARALDDAAVGRLLAIVGASYGGMIALSFGSAYPHRVGHLIVISAAHASDPMATALRVLQRRVVELGVATGQPAQALAIARGIALTGYGTPAEFRSRFAPEEAGHAGLACRNIEQHLAAAGEAFARSCSPARFLALSRSLDLHRIRPEDVLVPAAVLAVREDQLVPIEQARELAARLGAPCRLWELESIYGHDAFLNEPALLAPILGDLLTASTGLMS
ncbi:MAG: homoserine O-succinyltransferase MetX [Gemmatimonadaceae bacterium]